MDYIYMSVVMTEFGTHTMPTTFHFYERLGGEAELTSKKLDAKAAYKLMWELKLAGATKEITTNPKDSSIHTVRVAYWARR